VRQVGYLQELTDFLFINSWHCILLRNGQLILCLSNLTTESSTKEITDYFVTASNWIISWGSYIIPVHTRCELKAEHPPGPEPWERHLHFTSDVSNKGPPFRFVGPLSNLNPNIECCQTNAGEDYIYFKDSEFF